MVLIRLSLFVKLGERCPQIKVVGATKSTEDNLPGTMVRITCDHYIMPLVNHYKMSSVE